MAVKIKHLILVIFLFSIKAIPSDCPIIFIHGHRAEARPEGTNENPDKKDVGGWVTWYPRDYNGNFKYHSAMTKIADAHYGGYRYGLKYDGSTAYLCDKTTQLMITPDTRRIYHFSFYRPDGGIGVIGSNGNLASLFVISKLGAVRKKSEIPQSQWLYGYDFGSNNPLSGDKWAENLADFIDKVLTATGVSKVDIVAHSMGGLVARAAMKYYGCENKIRKLLTVGTPNHYYDWAFGEWWWCAFADDPSWMRCGEDWGMSADRRQGEDNITFEDISTGVEKPFTEFLDVSPSEGIATIAGKKGWSVGPTNDRVVTVDQVHLSSAQFNPVIYASHSRGWTDWNEEALPNCTYTTEFIKKWMIDDEIITNASLAGGNWVLPDPWPSTFSGGLRKIVGVNSYQNVLCFSYSIYTLTGDLYVKNGIPLYKCSKGIPGYPVILKEPGNLAPGKYIINYRINDMNHGEVAYIKDEKFVISDYRYEYKGSPIQGAFVNIEKPEGGEYYAGDKIWIRWDSDEYVLSKKIYFSTDGGNTYERIFSLGSRTTLEEEPWIKDSVEWIVPVVASNQCKIKMVQNLDNVVFISDDSETFSVPGDIYLERWTINIGETKTFQAYNSITASANSTGFLIKGNGSNGGNVTMAAGDIIYIEPEFEAQEGCTFHAYVDPSIRWNYGSTTLASAETKSLTIIPEPEISNKDSNKLSAKLSSKETKEPIPKVFSCLQNYPNPFMRNTTIKYGLPKNCDNVNLTIFNLAGQAVKTLVNEQQSAGYKSVSWNGKNSASAKVPQGIYFYVFKAGDFEKHHKMILIK